MAEAPPSKEEAERARERARRLAGEAHLNATLVALDDAPRASALPAAEWARIWLDGVRAHVAREPPDARGIPASCAMETRAAVYFAQGFEYRCAHAFEGDRRHPERTPRKWFNLMASNAAFQRMEAQGVEEAAQREHKRKHAEAAAVLQAAPAAPAARPAKPAYKRPRVAAAAAAAAAAAVPERGFKQFRAQPESVGWALAPAALEGGSGNNQRDAAYHALFTHRHDLWAPRGGGKVHTAPTALGARLAEALAAAGVLQVTADDMRAYKRDHRRCPQPITDLGLVPFAAGSYNAVWGLRCPKAGGLAPVLELAALRGADPHKVVLRTPLRDPKHRSAGTHDADEALEEVLKVAGAAAGGFGVGLLGVALVPKDVRNRDAVAPDEGATCTRFHVCTVLERAGHTLHTRLCALDVSTRVCAAAQQKYFEAVAAAVWRLSVDARIVNLDGKPENYMDLNFAGGAAPLLFDGASFDPAHQVVAIDLDEIGARRLVPPGEAVAGQGWRIVWAYNALFLSCMMRESGMPESRFQEWFRPLQKALNTVVREAELGRPTDLRSDADYDHALRFAKAARWHGRAIPTDADAARKPVFGTDPATVAREAVRFVAWYFYVIWHDRMRVPGGAECLEDRLNAVLECRRRNDLAGANERVHDLVNAYRSEGRRRIATMRYFADRLRDGPKDGAPMLLRVLLDFACTEPHLLREHYAEGRSVLARWGGHSWPPLPRAADLQTLIEPGGVWERGDAAARRREVERFFGEPSA